MYAPKDRPEILVPVRLDLASTFTFTCEPKVACFGRCCQDAQIMLTPYDIVRMKNRFGITSDEFLALYTVPGPIENTELPIPYLKTIGKDERTCPFLDVKGCGIYEDRPVSCRYYPLGAGIFHNRDASEKERFFALVKEPHCLGHGLGREWTVREWIEDQGIPEYDEVNAGWVELILKRKSLGPFVTIPEKTLKMFFMGCYNVDGFRRFVFDSKFLDIYVVPQDRIDRMENDDKEILIFAFEWLKGTLYGEGKLPLRTQTATAEAE